MFRTTIDPTLPMRPCTFVTFWCPIHGLSSTVSQMGLAAVLCFPCSQATAHDHAEQRDPWCSADLCDHLTDIPAPKENPMAHTMLRVTDEIVGGVATVDLVNVRDYLLDMFGMSPDPEMTGSVIDILTDKLNRGEPFDGECAYLGIKVERL